jgi:hypothetical protein
LSLLQINSTMTVDGIDYYVTTNYGEELYNSCKDVKFGTLNTRAMDFIGAGSKTYKGKMKSLPDKKTLFCCWVSNLMAIMIPVPHLDVHPNSCFQLMLLSILVPDWIEDYAILNALVTSSHSNLV